jgi:hypothetical protein
MTARELRSKIQAEAVGHLLGLAEITRTNSGDPLMQKIVCKNLIEYADEFLEKTEVAEVLAEVEEVLHEPLFIQ